MALTVLSDQDINNLLESLTADEAEALALSLKSTLHEYSTGTQGPGAFHQPERTVVHDEASNVTTLFMPSSCSRRGHGVKVVTLSGPGGAPDGRPPIRPTGTVTLFGPDGAPRGLVHAKTLTAFRTALASTCLLQKRAAVRTLVAFGAGAQAYWHVRLALLLRGPTVRNVYLVNHRYSDAARQTLQKLYAVPAEVRRREGWEQAAFSLLTPGFGEFDRLLKEYLRAADVVYCCTPSTEPLFDASILTNTEGRKKGRLIVAIGSYKPEMRELPRALLEQAVKPTHGTTGFLHLHKHATEGGVIVVDTIDGCLKEAGELIEAGLEPRQLVELGELVMIKRAMMQEDEDGSVISGSSTDVSSDMDKLDLASCTPSMSTVFGSDGASTTGSSSKRSSSGSPKRKGSGLFPRRSSRSASTEPAKKGRDDHLSRWLTAGNVVYKSVGMGLMDLVVGMDVVQLAREKGVGTMVENFS